MQGYCSNPDLDFKCQTTPYPARGLVPPLLHTTMLGNYMARKLTTGTLLTSDLDPIL